MNEVQYDRMQEEAAMGAAMSEMLSELLADWGEKSFAQLDRRVYKATRCGASIGIELWEGGFVWSGDPRLTDISVGAVKAIGVGSIVEGTDQTVEHRFLDLTDFLSGEPGKTLHEAFDALVSEVDEEAQQIWNETHGCQHCGTGTDHVEGGPCGICEREDAFGDEHSIDPECLWCHGEGMVI